METKIGRTVKSIWGLCMWALLGVGIYYLLKWILGGQISDGAIQGFVWGGGLMFFGLTAYGFTIQKKQELDRQKAMDQFIKDQKADTEKQAKIDKEIIE